MAKINYVDHRYGHRMAYAMFSAILGKEVTEENMTYNDVRKAVGCIRIGDTPFNQRWDVSPYDLEDTVHMVSVVFSKNAAAKGEIATAATYKDPHEGITVDYTGMEPKEVKKPATMNPIKRFLNKLNSSFFRSEKARIEEQRREYNSYCEKMKFFERLRNDSEGLTQGTADHVREESIKRANELGTNDPDYLTPEEIQFDKIAAHMKETGMPLRQPISFSEINKQSTVTRTTPAPQPVLENEFEQEFVL